VIPSAPTRNAPIGHAIFSPFSSGYFPAGAELPRKINIFSCGIEGLLRRNDNSACHDKSSGTRSLEPQMRRGMGYRSQTQSAAINQSPEAAPRFIVEVCRGVV
jgi:hypothetical protein